MEFKIGDKVLVVGDEKYYWVMEMNDYIGKVFTVSSVSYNCDGQVVKFEECKWKFSFSAHDLKLVEDNEFMKYGFDEFIEKDDINSPTHYTHGEYEPIKVIKDWELNFNLGNVIKYIARAEYKGDKLKDLRKARFYLDDEIKHLEKKEGENYCEEVD